ncbi:hypothetical protein [Streptomyces sp. NPDC002520]
MACIKGGEAGRDYRIPRSVIKGSAACLDPLEGSRARGSWTMPVSKTERDRLARLFGTDALALLRAAHAPTLHHGCTWRP